jgi:anti-anti-sigma factor
MSLIKVSQARGHVPVTVLHLQDRVNLGNTAELEKAAQEAYEDGMRDVVIDLKDAPSLTSAGIRAIVALHKMLMKGESEGSARHLKLVSPTSYVREVLDIAGLSEYIEIYDSVEEAVASFV